MQNQTQPTAAKTTNTVKTHRSFWTRFWESLRNSLGTVCC